MRAAASLPTSEIAFVFHLFFFLPMACVQTQQIVHEFLCVQPACGCFINCSIDSLMHTLLTLMCVEASQPASFLISLTRRRERHAPNPQVPTRPKRREKLPGHTAECIPTKRSPPCWISPGTQRPQFQNGTPRHPKHTTWEAAASWPPMRTLVPHHSMRPWMLQRQRSTRIWALRVCRLVWPTMSGSWAPALGTTCRRVAATWGTSHKISDPAAIR